MLLELALALLHVTLIAGAQGQSAAGAPNDAQPRLPNPQWRDVPHSRAAGVESSRATTDGNQKDSRGKGPTAANAILPPQPASFEERCAQPGVVLCDPLDNGRVHGVGITDRTPNATLPEAVKGHYRDWRWCARDVDTVPRSGLPPVQGPVVDEIVKASGSGSLKFVYPTRSGPGDAGYCQINFTPDKSVQFGEGDTFFVQFRVRFSCTLLFNDCDPLSPGYKTTRRVYRSRDGDVTSFKVSIINAGDHAALSEPVDSCTEQHLVLVAGTNGIVAGYHSCGWYDGHIVRVGQERGRALWDYQPKMNEMAAHCLNRSPSEALQDCVLWPADEWVTITQQVTVGKWVARLDDPARTSNVRIWMQRRGEKPVLVVDYDRNLRAPEKPFMKYGKIWLLPYMTNKDPRQDHPEAYMWFDELIVSRAPIPPALD